MEILSNLLLGFSNIIIVIVNMFIFKLILDKNSAFNINGATSLINSKAGIPLSIRRAGIFLSLLIGSLGVVNSNIYMQILDQTLLFIFLFSAIYLSDKILFNKVSNTKEIINGNLSLAISEFGLFVSTGIIAYASFNGEGPWYTSIVFFILGQLTFLLISYIYEKAYKNIKTNILKNKISSGIFLGSIMIAMSFIIKSAIIGDFISWQNDLMSFFIYTISGIILLFLSTNFIIDKVFLPEIRIKEALEKDLVSPVIILASIKIGLAILINFLL
jgi:uncharacterized membrane protein YjfL (UPF0719 family)